MKYKNFDDIVKLFMSLSSNYIEGLKPNKSSKGLVINSAVELTPMFALWSNGQNAPVEPRIVKAQEDFKLMNNPEADALLKEIEAARESNDDEAKAFMKDVQLAALVFLNYLDSKDIRNSGDSLAFRKIKEMTDPELQRKTLGTFVYSIGEKSPLYETAATELANLKSAKPEDKLILMYHYRQKKDIKQNPKAQEIMQGLFDDIYAKAKEVFAQETAAKDPDPQKLAMARSSVIDAASNLYNAGIVVDDYSSLRDDIDAVLDIQKAIAGETEYIKQTEDGFLIAKSNLTSENGKLKANIEEQKTEIAGKDKDIEKLTGEKATQADEFKKKEETLISDRTKLSNQLSTEMQELARIKTELAKLQTELDSANKKLTMANGKVSMQSKTIIEIQNAAKDVRGGVGSKGVDNLKKMIEDINANQM